jgi:mRNA interferase MazF
MPSYQPGEILLLAFPFTDSSGAKRRPALVLIDTGDNDIIVARVTSQMASTSFDVTLTEWQNAGLLVASVVRTGKVATLEKRIVARSLGTLTPSDWSLVRSVVQRLWASV